MLVLDSLVHFVHVLSAAVWVGGTLFMSLVLSPALRAQVPAPARGPLVRAVGERFRKVGWAALGLLVLTGTWRIGPMWATLDWTGSALGVAFLIKFSLVAGVVALTALHDFVLGPRLAQLDPRADADEHPKQLSRLVFWARVNAALTVAVLFMGAWIRMNPF